MRIIILFITGLLLIIALLMYVMLLSHDISLQPVKNISGDNPIYLISYADGPEIFIQNQNAMAESAINKGIDFTFNYRKQHIDPDFINKHADIFARTQGA